MGNSDFSWGKMQQKPFEDVENELCAIHLYIHRVCKKATVAADAFEKIIGGFPQKRKTSSNICIKNVYSSEEK